MQSALMRRDDDLYQGFERHERYVGLEGKWYFTTREGIVMGPYPSVVEAKKATREYIDFIRSAPAVILKALNREKMTVSPQRACA